MDNRGLPDPFELPADNDSGWVFIFRLVSAAVIALPVIVIAVAVLA